MTFGASRQLLRDAQPGQICPDLADAARAQGGMFADGAVKLCHPHCSKFCVLGGGSCSGR